MALRQVNILISGRVQGVGFRYFARYKAEELNITGWVRNNYDNSVEIVATGESGNLNTFIDWMRRGPSHAIVQTFTFVEITPPQHFSGFSINR